MTYLNRSLVLQDKFHVSAILEKDEDFDIIIQEACELDVDDETEAEIIKMLDTDLELKAKLVVDRYPLKLMAIAAKAPDPLYSWQGRGMGHCGLWARRWCHGLRE